MYDQVSVRVLEIPDSLGYLKFSLTLRDRVIISGRWWSLENGGATSAWMIIPVWFTKTRSRRLRVPLCMRVAVFISCVRASVSAVFQFQLEGGDG